jgi:hypothetical protein
MIMRKTLIGLAALLALSGSALAGDFDNSLHHPKSATAPQLDYSSTASVKTNAPEKQRTQAPAPVSSRHTYGDSANGVVLPMGNAR